MPSPSEIMRQTGQAFQFFNETDMEFTDISSEEYREYQFDKVWVRIPGPLLLNVSESGGHRLFDRFGICHYIAPKWISIRWRPWEGAPHFVK